MFIGLHEERGERRETLLDYYSLKPLYGYKDVDVEKYNTLQRQKESRKERRRLLIEKQRAVQKQREAEYDRMMEERLKKSREEDAAREALKEWSCNYDGHKINLMKCPELMSFVIGKQLPIGNALYSILEVERGLWDKMHRELAEQVRPLYVDSDKQNFIFSKFIIMEKS